MPLGVPLNNNDPADGRPPDYLDEKGEPLYFLPWLAGEIRPVGVRNDREPTGLAPPMADPEKDYRPRHALCFLMPAGTRVVAARGGIVTRVASQTANLEGNEFARVIEVTHRDGTVARYWHLQQFAASVKPGQFVYRGQLLAASGTTGLSRHQHLRFEVGRPAPTGRKWNKWRHSWWEPYRKFETIPVKFADVAEEDGIPREGRWYRSRNVWVPNVF
jgi:murein DD-endopeptidase MepM/ murein hydrolase activator NlpD